MGLGGGLGAGEVCVSISKWKTNECKIPLHKQAGKLNSFSKKNSPQVQLISIYRFKDKGGGYL